MVARNAHKPKSSKISAAAAPASSLKASLPQSSVLRSSFCPSRLQLSIFASVIRGLDSEHVHLHDTLSGRLLCDHAVDPKQSVTCLDWGYYGADHVHEDGNAQSKKRKRSHGNKTFLASNDAISLAIGTSGGQVEFFSPARAAAAGQLVHDTSSTLKDFRFVDDGLRGQAWSITVDGRLFQWDLKLNTLLRTIRLSQGPFNKIQPIDSSIIYASDQAYFLDPASSKETQTFHASTNSVETIIVGTEAKAGRRKFLTAARNDRFLNVFDVSSGSHIGTLRAENAVAHADLASASGYHPIHSTENEPRASRRQEALAVVNTDGILEIFQDPFDFSNPSELPGQNNLKAKMQRRTRKSVAQARFLRDDQSASLLPLANLVMQESHVTVAWIENGVTPRFKTIRWQAESGNDPLWRGTTDFVDAKDSSTTQAAQINGAKDMSRMQIDQAQTIVTNGLGDSEAPGQDQDADIISISSGREESDSSDGEAYTAPNNNASATPFLENGNEVKDASREQPVHEPSLPLEGEGQTSSHEHKEPSFGEQLRARAGEPINIAEPAPKVDLQVEKQTSDQTLRLTQPGMSLGTILAQSLRTNDRDLLQTCLQVRDLSIIRSTIERLDTVLVPTLLFKLTERLHNSPGRAGSLMVWIQWTLIAHGGSLAGRSDVMKNLHSLHRVVQERASSLQPLLCLKGKLDMLEAQMNLRRSKQERARRSSEESEDDVVYVEGEDESDSEAGEDDEEMGIEARETRMLDERSADKPHSLNDALGDDGSDSGREMPPVNGQLMDTDDAESEEEGLVDLEAMSVDEESSEQDSADEVEHDDIESGSSDGEDSLSPDESGDE